MNAALQCILHLPKVKEYYLSEEYENDINTKNVLGTKGKISKAFADLAKKYYNERLKAISPTKFKVFIHSSSFFLIFIRIYI